MSHWLRVGLDRVTIYLPILMAAALALGTYWLVRNAPLLLQSRPPAPVTHDPDYFMRDFVVKRFFPSGELRSELRGKEGRHYPDTDTIEIDQARVRAVAPDGSLAIAEAKRALSNGDGSELQLMGDVHLRRLPPGSGENAPALMEMRGEFLQALSNSEILRSHLPVTIRQGGATLNAQNFEYRHLTGQVSFTGRAQGQINAQPRR